MKLLGLIYIFFILTCQSEKPTAPEVGESRNVETINVPQTSPQIDTSTNNHYPWVENYLPENALINRISVPEGFRRTIARKTSFEDWLRHLPMKSPDSKVMLYNREQKWRQDVHEAVVAIDVGKRDLQQCADAVMRLKAEFHFSLKEFNAIHFNFTSGDRVAFDDWRKGRKPIISGNRVTFSSPNGSVNSSYQNFKKYMTQIFSYAGTASLSKEMEKIELKDMKIGDVFIQGGFPGHAVIVVDMVENDQGEKRFLLAQSYMPAQDIHILKNLDNPAISPWFSGDIEEKLVTPEWTFSKNDLRRF